MQNYCRWWETFKKNFSPGMIRFVYFKIYLWLLSRGWIVGLNLEEASWKAVKIEQVHHLEICSALNNRKWWLTQKRGLFFSQEIQRSPVTDIVRYFTKDPGFFLLSFCSIILAFILMVVTSWFQDVCHSSRHRNHVQKKKNSGQVEGSIPFTSRRHCNLLGQKKPVTPMCKRGWES